MEILVDGCIDQVLNSLSPQPVHPSKEEYFLACMVCKNLADLCETGRAILDDMQSRGMSVNNLPRASDIQMCQRVFDRFYSESMFQEDDELGSIPNWDAISNFDQRRGNGAFKIYLCIKHNVIDKPIGKDIQIAAQRRDEKYFIDNFDTIFANVPFKDALLKFKNFVASNAVLETHREYIWDFFDSLMEIFINERENLDDLKAFS
jgi:hypothetical protein